VSLAARLRKHVEVLALEIGDRHVSQGTAMLNRTAEYIRHNFESYGYTVSELQYGDGAQQFRNICVELPGRTRAGEIIVMGAHYDTVAGSPGADDNSSGIAALLELAHLLKDAPLARTVRLIAFPNEEHPLGTTEMSGSVVSARESRIQNENIIGMFSLEMLGYYSREPRTQHFPKYVPPIFPDAANFIAFVSNITSRNFLRKSLLHFRRQQLFPSEGLAVPELLVPSIARSDNRSYWRAGFHAVMITDTAEFRNPHYHAGSDLPDTLDYPSYARVVMALNGMLKGLANG
jgi:Zn-dependent M28 family amino/carboxypeptidase